MTAWVVRVVLPGDRDPLAVFSSMILDFPDCNIILSMEDDEK